MRISACHPIIALCAVALGCPEPAPETPTSASPFEGTIEYRVTDGETLICDATIALLGRRTDTECPDCDFVFEVDATVVEDRGTADCEFDPTLSFVAPDGDPDRQSYIAFLSEYTYWDYTWSNTLMSGYSSDYGGTDWNMITFDFEGYYTPWLYDYFELYIGEGAATLEDDVLTWSISRPIDPPEDAFLEYCDDGIALTGGELPEGGTRTNESLPADGDSIDVWAFEAEAGGTYNLAVDTLATDTAFDPDLWVNGPDTCTIAMADDEFECTFPAVESVYECPAITFVADATGTYQAVVGSLQRLDGTGALARLEEPIDSEYQLVVASGTDPALTLLEDDHPRVVMSPARTEVTGTATIIRE